MIAAKHFLRSVAGISFILILAISFAAHGAVTIITHGLNGNTDGWITGMANQIPNHAGFLGTNFSCYKISFVSSGGGYVVSAARFAGTPASEPESGEIIIKLDWRDLADGNSYDTYQVAAAVLPALLSTNFISELNGHAIAEFPLHLIGHSRGGSLVCEISRLLGTNGIWVDHVTTLDPHPLNDPAFPLDRILFSAVDAPANTYANVLFHDNIWQNIEPFVYGKSVAGAYVRKLLTLGGGYSSAHSDVHLWYQGTIDLRTPASDTETSGNITASERATWWSSFESRGTNAGFLYSLIGRGDRTSTAQPAGAGLGMVRDGFNQNWDLGVGTFANRVALPSNNGDWPNLLLLNRTTTNAVAVGEAMPMRFYFQWAKPDTNLATIHFYLDDDLNPLNANETLLGSMIVPATGAEFVSIAATNLTLPAVTPGVHTLLATINGGSKTRFLYAPEMVQLLPAREPPNLEITRLNSLDYRISVIGSIGQTVVLQTSTDFETWLPIVTNTLTATRWDFTNSVNEATEREFFRAVVP